MLVSIAVDHHAHGLSPHEMEHHWYQRPRMWKLIGLGQWRSRVDLFLVWDEQFT